MQFIERPNKMGTDTPMEELDGMRVVRREAIRALGAVRDPGVGTKKGAEAICHSYHHLFGLNISLLRYFTVYGPFGRPDMALFRFVHWISNDQPVFIYGDGQQQRDFTYIEDIARGTVAAIELPGMLTADQRAGREPQHFPEVGRKFPIRAHPPGPLRRRPPHYVVSAPV